MTTYRTPATFGDLQPHDTFAWVQGGLRFRRAHNANGFYTDGPWPMHDTNENPARPVFDVITHEQQADEHDAKRAAEHAAHNAKVAAFREKAKAVSAILGFTIEPPEAEGGRYDTRATIVRGAQRIVLGMGGYRREGRITVHGILPALGDQRWGRSFGEITMADSKSAEAIARDIARRLLPEYIKALAEAITRRDAEAAFQERRQENKRALAQALGVTLHERERSPEADRFQITVGQHWGQAIVSDAEVSLEVRHLTMAQALAIARILRG